MTTVRLTPLKGPVKATVSVPGSKSYTNRALLLAAMTPHAVAITGALQSDDTAAMLGCLRRLDMEITESGGAIQVAGDVSSVKDAEYELDAALSGTTMRFMLALCAVLPGRQTLRAQAGLQKRPIGHLVNALRQLGGDIEYLDREGYPPLLVKPFYQASSSIELDGSESSQYLSALLMVAPLVDGLAITLTGALISKPYADMTLEAMQQFGVEVSQSDERYQIDGGQTYHASNYDVEGDISSASYFFAIAALTGSTLTVENLNPHSLQADMGFLQILSGMGAGITKSSNSITVQGHGVQPLSVTMKGCPDQAQTLAVLAAFADGTTVIDGIQSLRVKETERIKALEQELAKMDIKTDSSKGSLTIHGGRPQVTSIATYDDHRMAMAFAVAGAKLEDMRIEDPDVVTKTFPEFWEKLAAIGVGVERSTA